MSKFKPSSTGSAVRKPNRRRPATNSAPAAETSASTLTTETPSGDNEEPEPAGAQVFGFYAVLLFVFFRFSFLHEFIGAQLNANLHIIILVGGASYLCWLLSGHPLRAFQERSTWLWTCFLCWMAFATCTSFWKGGSFHIFWDYLETAFPSILVIPALVTNKRQILKVVNVMGLACIATVLLGAINDDFKSGRMGVNVASSEIQNPNDFAAHLILMLPVLAFWGFRKGRSMVHKLIAGGCIALALRLVLSSGSRGGLIALAVTALYLVFSGSRQAKTAILVGVPVLALITIPFVPRESLSRLATLVSSSAAAKDDEAIESQEARLTLLKDSLKFTLEHPLSGIGPGEFMDFQAQDAAENGHRGMWHVTHNAYTQVSCECGIPAFLFYMGALGVTFSNLRKIIKTKDEQLAPIAATILTMYIGFGVCIFFLSMAYAVHILILSAITVSMKLRLSKQIAEQESNQMPATPEAVPV